jgi:hypothetical protein
VFYSKRPSKDECYNNFHNQAAKPFNEIVTA